jgi:hypothetical protein
MYNCVEKQKLYRQCTDQNTKARECRAELEALFACIYESDLKRKYLYVL